MLVSGLRALERAWSSCESRPSSIPLRLSLIELSFSREHTQPLLKYTMAAQHEQVRLCNLTSFQLY